MKKVLLIGELNQTVSNLNNYLTDYYNTQICADNFEIVKGMVKVFQPNLALICLVGVNELDIRILDFLQNEKEEISVILIGTEDECKKHMKYYESRQFDFIFRPTTQTALLQKCNEMLETESAEEADEVEEIVSVGTSQEKKKHILIIDDSAMSLRNIKAILDPIYQVSVAMDGEKGLATVKKKHPDLILLDYEMPGWDGKKTLEEIRSDEEIMDIPVMFLTGVADKEHIAAVLGMNPVGYLLKPVEQNKLLQMIEEVFFKLNA